MVAAFRFRLQKILEFRERELETQQRMLAQSQVEVRRLEAVIAVARRERVQHDESLRLPETGPLLPIDLRARLATTEALTQREAMIVQQLQQARQLCVTQRERTLVANRELRVLEKLRDRSQQRFKREIDAQERKILDDIQSRYGEDPLDTAESPTRRPR